MEYEEMFEGTTLDQEQLFDVVSSCPTAEDWRDNLNLNSNQYGQLRYKLIPAKELLSPMIIKQRFGGRKVLENSLGLLEVISDNETHLLTYKSKQASYCGFRLLVYGDHFYFTTGSCHGLALKGHNLDKITLANHGYGGRSLPELMFCKGTYNLGRTFEDVYAQYGDDSYVSTDGGSMMYDRDNGQVVRRSIIPSLRCKPSYQENVFRDIIFENNMKEFRPSLRNLF